MSHAPEGERNTLPSVTVIVHWSVSHAESRDVTWKIVQMTLLYANCLTKDVNCSRISASPKLGLVEA